MAVGIIDATQAPGFVDYTQEVQSAATPAFDVLQYAQDQNAAADAGAGMPVGDQPIDPRTLPQIKQGDTLAALAQNDPALAGYDQSLADFQQRYKAAADQIEQSRANAGKPLNRVLSGVQGVLGLPFRLLENVVGGENNDLTAAFKPQRTANTIAQARLATLDNARAEFVKDISAARTQRIGLLGKLLEDQGKKAKDAYGIAANAATLALQADDPQRFFAETMQRSASTNPLIGELGLDKLSWRQDLPRTLAALTGDKETLDRLDKATGYETINVADGGTAVRVSRDPSKPAMAVTTTGQDVPLSGFTASRFVVGDPAAPSTATTPPPALNANGLPAALTPDQYKVTVAQMGKGATDAWMKRNGITLAAPANNVPPPPPGFVVEQ